MNKILIIGAGELGSAIINSLLGHSAYSPNTTSLTLLVRPSSIEKYSKLQSRGVSLIGKDVYAASESQLAAAMKNYTTVIHAGNMGAPAGTQLKVTNAVLTAGVQLYLPWQFGVDYDVITREGGEGIFNEPIDVREMLRAQKQTQWLIISAGIFTSFLFEELWGVVERDKNGRVNGVHALGSWDDKITMTDAEGIGKCTANLIFDAASPRNQPVFISGDTLTYTELADVVERVIGKQVVKDVWTTDYLRKQLHSDPSDQLKKYRVVFSEGKGLSWGKEKTWNTERGIELEGAESWFKRKYLDSSRPIA